MTTLPIPYIRGADCLERKVELSGTTTIGRAIDNDIVLDDEAVSQCHAMLFMHSDGVLLIDLESTNSTFVNGVHVLPDAPVRLTHGDLVTIGRQVLRFEAPHAVCLAAPSPC
jgi:pSer/pThr/pTyr-binding forkhead associated (FHA) protein